MTPRDSVDGMGEVRHRRRPLLGAALLLGAAVIWGFAFVPQKLTVVGLPPLTATLVRFAIAAPLALLVSMVVSLVASFVGRARHASATNAPARRRLGVKGAVVLGTLLFFVYTLQTAGLVYAPVARVGIITGMYAVFVPLFAPLLGHARPTRAHWLGTVLAFAGLLGLVGIVGDTSALSTPLNIGDVLVLGHSLLAAFQVLLVGRLARDADPFVLNAVQLSTVLAIAIPGALLVDGLDVVRSAFTMEKMTLFAFLYLAMFSTVLAFTFQLLGQRHTSPPTAAVIMLLETPVAVLAALVFLDESMGWTQWIGALVLLGGVVVSLVPELRRPYGAAADAAEAPTLAPTLAPAPASPPDAPRP